MFETTSHLLLVTFSNHAIASAALAFESDDGPNLPGICRRLERPLIQRLASVTHWCGDTLKHMGCGAMARCHHWSDHRIIRSATSSFCRRSFHVISGDGPPSIAEASATVFNSNLLRTKPFLKEGQLLGFHCMWVKNLHPCSSHPLLLTSHNFTHSSTGQDVNLPTLAVIS